MLVAIRFWNEVHPRGGYGVAPVRLRDDCPRHGEHLGVRLVRRVYQSFSTRCGHYLGHYNRKDGVNTVIFTPNGVVEDD